MRVRTVHTHTYVLVHTRRAEVDCCLSHFLSTLFVEILSRQLSHQAKLAEGPVSPSPVLDYRHIAFSHRGWLPNSGALVLAG